MREKAFICILVQATVQALNVWTVAYCLARGDYWPSILIGGSGKIFADAFLMHQSWRGRAWAKYTLGVFWGLVAAVAIFYAYRSTLSPTNDALPILGLGVLYLFLVGLLFIAIRPSVRVRPDTP